MDALFFLSGLVRGIPDGAAWLVAPACTGTRGTRDRHKGNCYANLLGGARSIKLNRAHQHSKHRNRSYLQPSLFISRTLGTSLIVADRKHAQIDTDG